MPDLFAGSPVLVAVRARKGELVVRGRTESGPWEQRVHVPEPLPAGRRAIPAFFARECVEDLETEIAADGDAELLGKSIEAIGLRFGVSTRLTSWFAVSEERTVDPSAPLRRVRMPQGLPHGMSVEGLGLRALRDNGRRGWDDAEHAAGHCFHGGRGSAANARGPGSFERHPRQ